MAILGYFLNRKFCKNSLLSSIIYRVSYENSSRKTEEKKNNLIFFSKFLITENSFSTSELQRYDSAASAIPCIRQNNGHLGTDCSPLK